MELLTEKSVRRLCYVMAGLFLLIHVGMLLVFRTYQVTPMVWINVGSILFYLGMLLLIRMDRLRLFVTASFLEICFHMGAAVWCVGRDAGFQIVLIGICVLLHYAEYVGRTKKMEWLRSIVLVPVAAVAYLIPLIASFSRTAPYSLPESLNAGFQIFWAAIVFVIMLIILQFFVVAAVKSQERLTAEAVHDRLTGLPNRYYIASVLSGMMKESCWLAILDLDGFKQVNDTYGHNCGDYILKTVAGLLRETEGVELCRWGGEEFLMLGTEKSLGGLEKARARIEQYPFEYNHEIRLRMTVTVGMAWYREGWTIDEWIETADQMLYEGKKGGKNRIVSAPRE